MVTAGEPLSGRLREALQAAGYRYDAVTGLLGAVAHAALSRNETTPGLRATAGGSPLETLVRLWLLQAPVARDAAARALPGLVGPLGAAGLLEVSGGEARALVDVRPYADEERDWWLVSDLTPGLDGAPVRVSTDHVLGVSSASTSLAQLTVREPVATAFDLGTGCGVQALHLSCHATRVVASDVNERALAMTRLNAALSGSTSRCGPAACSSPSRASGSTWWSPTRPSSCRRATRGPLSGWSTATPGCPGTRWSAGW